MNDPNKVFDKYLRIRQETVEWTDIECLHLIIMLTTDFIETLSQTERDRFLEKYPERLRESLQDKLVESNE